MRSRHAPRPARALTIGLLIAGLLWAGLVLIDAATRL